MTGLTSITRIVLAGTAAVLFAAVPAFAQSENGGTAVKRSRAQVAQTRTTSIVVTPRSQRLSPDARRHCEAWLEKEYRVSGTVIVPRQRCWWQ